MEFHSFTFLYFLATVLAGAAVLRFPLQNWMLLAASYVFYGWWDARFLGLLVFTTTLDWACARAIGARLAAASKGGARRFLFLSVGANLAVLGVFKYYDFFATSFADLLAAIGLAVTPATLDVVLPVGVSFYSFQAIAYVVDVYRGRIQATRPWQDVALFIAFFPQLVAGPIERARDLIPQIQAPRVVTWESLRFGGFLLLSGWFKKCVVADNLAPFVMGLSTDPGSASGGEVAVGFYAMVFFLYADFSGYSDLARGAASLLGFSLSPNFRRPLFATSPAEFWRRWHLTLTAWFRDYLYAPLSSLWPARRRSGVWLVACAMVTLVLAGLWHGAAWNFVIFGASHGVLLALYFALKPALERAEALAARGGAVARGTYTLITSVVGWHLLAVPVAFFLIPNVRAWRGLAETLVRGAYDSAALVPLATLVIFGGLLVALDAACERAGDDLAPLRWPAWARLACYVTLLLAIVLAGATETREFVYFQF